MPADVIIWTKQSKKNFGIPFRFETFELKAFLLSIKFIKLDTTLAIIEAKNIATPCSRREKIIYY